jgi:diketogulonate reductase-like aldo/keto reductase
MGGEIAEITKEDVCNMVSNMQHAIDHGLTTLQLKPYTDSSKSKQLQYDVYQTLIEQTPKSILEQQSQIIVPVSIDDVLETKDFAIKSISSKSVRNHVLTLLDRLGTDCLDNIQIRFPNSVDHNTRSITSKMSTKNNHLTSKIGYDVMTAQFDNNQRRVDDRYYFDMIYELQELVREGYVRSISSKDLTSTMYQHIQSNHLHTLFNTNQLDLNLCRITPLIKAQPPVGQNSETDTTSITQHTIAANPLAGGWLVDRYFVESHHHLRQKRTPTSAWFRSLSQQEQWNWDQNIVQSWMSTRRTKQASSVGASNHDFGAVWDVYQMELLKPLRDIAMKHGVSVASVVLRWTLQQHEHVPTTNAAMSRHSAMCSSTVISCRLLPEHMYWDTHRPFTTVTERVQQLREVLRFTLDDDDIEKLWTLSSYIEPVVPDPIIVNNNYYDDNIEVSSSGLYIPKR